MAQAPYIQGLHQIALMKDGAPIHTARISNEWRTANGIIKMPWPAHSPDLNPIKNLSKKMKIHVIKHYKAWKMDDLQVAITAAWNKIPVNFLNQLLHSMAKRMEVVINANGGSTRWQDLF
ncbi:hypothetical protein O181_116007 [Austropuccinia psidii MF-1]|uniref:Tc1-like transposase DDE domain-containing protein n=1 Tax=Austropuccinia psidii MF-1 TaxID=1389203 RepID=A0A9Q3PXY3_9BASI|nr:hypothetical protein [Austropuccinia psidii MF-1]